MNDTTKAVYCFITKYIQENNGLSPSYREIAAGVDKVISVVKYHLLVLKDLGMITQIPGRARSVRPVEGKGAECE